MKKSAVTSTGRSKVVSIEIGEVSTPEVVLYKAKDGRVFGSRQELRKHNNNKLRDAEKGFLGLLDNYNALWDGICCTSTASSDYNFLVPKLPRIL